MPSAPIVRLDRRAVAGLLISAVLLVAVLVAAERIIGWRAVVETGRRIPPATWVWFAALMACSYAARAMRLWALVRPFGKGTRLTRTASVFLVHNALVTFLPARLGEVALPVLAHRWAALDWRPMIGVLAWWRIADLTVVAALALVLLGLGADALAPLVTFAIVACALPFVAFGVRHRVLHVLERPGPARHRAATLLARVLHGMPATWWALSADIAIAFVAWTSKFAALTMLVHEAVRQGSAGAALPGWPLVAAAALAGDVASSLPLPSLAGVGPYEAGVVAGLTAFAVPLGVALAAALLLHGALLATVLLAGVLGMLMHVARGAEDVVP